jgi:hypothetical protein
MNLNEKLVSKDTEPDVVLNPAVGHSEVSRGEISATKVRVNHFARVEDMRMVLQVVPNAWRAMWKGDTHKR